jgi:pimeloyl-ACP methyl ester carboxylesterase
MMRSKRKWLWTTGILIIVILLWAPVKHISMATKIALSIKNLADGASGQNLAVAETKISRRNGSQTYDALCYRPTQSDASTAIIVSAGISQLGCYHPRLVALSRALADKGLLVITPDIREFREFKIAASPIDQMLFWFKQVSTLEGGDKIRKIGLAGISYSGTLALMAAARPEIRNQAAFVIAIGPYYDLIRCTRNWFAAGTPAEGNGYYPTRFYAKWIIMLAALDMMAEPADRQFLQQVLKNLLLQNKIPPADSSLTAEGLRWYTLATMHPGQSDEQLSAKIEEYLILRIYRQLDPHQPIRDLQCPVFLIHGAYDKLIPPGESREIHQQVKTSYLLVSPFLTHTHLTGNKVSLKEKLVAAWDTLTFCYQVARTID